MSSKLNPLAVEMLYVNYEILILREQVFGGVVMDAIDDASRWISIMKKAAK